MKTLAAIFAFLFLQILIAGACAFYLINTIRSPGPLLQEKIVVVAKGSAVSTIAYQLEQDGVITSKFYFLAAHFLEGRPDLKAGEYKILPQASIESVVAKMASGKVFGRKVTLPEGKTSLEAFYALMAQKDLAGEITALPPDGTLLPETYQFTQGETRASIIARMQTAMREAVLAAWNARESDLPLTGPDQLLTLASIVEKETGVAAERAKVAGVFINRLRKGMPLQSDPTVIYGITEGRSLMTRALTFDDLKKPTAYNTYTIPALPPGPIANPGKAALMAVAKPEKHNFLYFVADGTGGHAFAETLEQHNANVANWRKINK